MSRITKKNIISEWRDAVETQGYFGRYFVQYADLRTPDGREHTSGAARVVTQDGRPALQGKGGTVPFHGETAWMDAERLADDLASADRWARD